VAGCGDIGGGNGEVREDSMVAHKFIVEQEVGPVTQSCFQTCPVLDAKEKNRGPDSENYNRGNPIARETLGQ